MDHLCRKSPGVFTAKGPITCITNEDISIIKKDAYASPLLRSRICIHNNTDDPVQEMIIALCKDSYIPPHRHVGKTESFHIIYGQADILFFEKTGDISHMISLGIDAPDGFYYRLSAPLFHTVLSRGEMVVIHETITGPFHPEENLKAPFAPDDKDYYAARKYLAMLHKFRDKMIENISFS